MTDENTQGPDAEGVDWGGTVDPEAVASWTPDDVGRSAPSIYPDFSDNPHNHRFTLSVTGDRAPMMVIRANTAAEMTAAVNELEAFGVWANVGAAHASMRAQGALGAGLGPVTPVAPQAPPPGPPQAPQAGYAPAPATPPPFGPNVSVPNAPGYQGPPQQQGWSAPPPPAQGGGWGGGGGGPQEKPRPAGWLMVDVPFNDKDRFKGMRAQNTESGNYLRGKIQWGGKGVYWLEPSIAQYVAQAGFPVTQ